MQNMAEMQIKDMVDGFHKTLETYINGLTNGLGPHLNGEVDFSEAGTSQADFVKR